MLRTFYFNTGVRQGIHNTSLYGNQVYLNGVVQIPFDCENVPKGAIFMFAAPSAELREVKQENVIVRKILNSELVSEYAYFQYNKK